MMEMMKRISAIGLMPVVAELAAMEDCLPLGEALIKGGIPAAEVTFRMAGAEKAIAMMRESFPSMIIGAGTVTNIDQAKKAINAGALFIVAPGLNEDVVAYCQQADVFVAPGISTASELEKAINLGLRMVKFFPSEQSGGLSVIKALCGPYKNVLFMPTGGINLDNIANYLAFDRIACCGGTFMLGNHLKTRDFASITQLCKKAVATMLGMRVAHVGINCVDEDDALGSAESFASLLSLPEVESGNSSVFSGSLVECMKSSSLGKHGHIAFKTINIQRTVNYLELQGIRFREETAERDANGRLKSIYFAEEIGGFAVRLVCCAGDK